MDTKLVILCFVSPKPVSVSHNLRKYGNLIADDFAVSEYYSNALLCSAEQYDSFREDVSSGKFDVTGIKISGWKNYNESEISSLSSFSFDQIFDVS
jgi:hypothetical protein